MVFTSGNHSTFLGYCQKQKRANLLLSDALPKPYYLCKPTYVLSAQHKIIAAGNMLATDSLYCR